jgi:hypothetical protein
MFTPMLASNFNAGSLKPESKSEIMITTYSSVSKDITPVASCAVTIKSNDITVFDGEIEELIAMLQENRK